MIYKKRPTYWNYLLIPMCKKSAVENFLYDALNHTDKDISDIEISSYEIPMQYHQEDGKNLPI